MMVIAFFTEWWVWGFQWRKEGEYVAEEWGQVFLFDEDAELWEGEEGVRVQTDGGDAGGY